MDRVVLRSWYDPNPSRDLILRSGWYLYLARELYFRWREERKKRKRKQRTREGKHGLEVRFDTRPGLENERYICPHPSILWH